MPFEHLDGYTYDFVGSHTVSGKSLRSSWGKRQATLVLYIFADGVKRLKPKLIFHGGASDRARIKAKEELQYSPGVTIEFNPKAYNEELFLKWLDSEYREVREAGAGNFLIVLDQATFHRTPKVLRQLKDQFTVPAIIPSSCTSLLQPLDTAINGAFKVLLRHETEQRTQDFEDRQLALGLESKWSVSQRRVLTTYAVAAA